MGHRDGQPGELGQPAWRTGAVGHRNGQPGVLQAGCPSVLELVCHDCVCVCGVGAEGFASEGDQEEVRRVERQLKNRFPIGSHVSEQRIVQDFLKQVSTSPGPPEIPLCRVLPFLA